VKLMHDEDVAMKELVQAEKYALLKEEEAH
jgi:hypothetical protein